MNFLVMFRSRIRQNNKNKRVCVINWWYTCLEADTEWLCGRPVTFRSPMGLIARDAPEGLDISIPEGTADLIALSPAEASTDNEPMHRFKLIWHHPEVFPDARQLPPSLTGRQLTNGRIPLRRLTAAEKTRLQDIIPLMGIEIRGKITGLADNRITLYPMQAAAPGVERRCPYEPAPIVFLITRFGEAVARYEMTPE